MTDLMEALQKPFDARDIEWRELELFPGYRVGSDGSIWSCRNRHGGLGAKWRLLVPDVGRLGHKRAKLFNADGEFRWLVHRLVLTCFVGPPGAGQEAAHNNGDARDNRIENLRWTTHKDNERDKFRHGTAQVGERHSRLKLNDEAVREIRRRYIPGVVTCVQLGKEFNVDQSLIHLIVKRKSWTHI